jgi:hypothetical protein
MPKRKRSTAGRSTTRRATGVPSNSEETVSEHEVLADAPATHTVEEEAGASANEAPAVVDPDPPAGGGPKLEAAKRAAPEDVRAASAVTLTAAGSEANAEGLQGTKPPPKRIKIKSYLVKKINP